MNRSGAGAFCCSLRKLDTYFPWIVFALNLCIRGWSNSTLQISRDEPFTLYFSQLEPHQFIPIILNTNNPPTFECLLHYWSHWFGHDTNSLRWIPTIIISAGAIPIYFFGKEIGGKFGSFFSSALFIGSGLLMNFAHLDRAYCILISGGIFMMICTAKSLESNSNRWLMLWCTIAVITCYSHYFGWLIVATNWLQVIFLDVSQNKNNLKKWTITSIILITLYLPLIQFITERFLITNQENSAGIVTPHPENLIQLTDQYLNGSACSIFIGTLLMLLSVKLFFIQQKSLSLCIFGLVMLFFVPRFSYLNSIGSWFGWTHLALLIVLAIIALRTIIRSKLSTLEKFCLWWAIIPLALGYMLSTLSPILNDRYFSFALPGILLAVVILFKQHKLQKLPNFASILFLCVFIFLFSSTPAYNVDNRAAIELFKKYHSCSELGIVGPGYYDVDFTYYYNSDIFYNGQYHYSDTTGTKLITDASYAAQKEGLRRELKENRILISHDSAQLDLDDSSIKSIAFFDGNLSLSYPENGIYPYLVERYGSPIESQHFEGVFSVYLFQKKAD